MNARNWKKCRCCQRRLIRSWIGWSAAPHAGHTSRLAWHSTAKWMAPSDCRKSTETTAHGGLRPNACVKRASIREACRPRRAQARAIPHGTRLIRNTSIGDGPRYKGRGIIQLTWKGTYQSYQDYSGSPVIENPESVASDLSLAV